MRYGNGEEQGRRWEPRLSGADRDRRRLGTGIRWKIGESGFNLVLVVTLEG